MSGKVVLDTNCLLMAISSRSRYYPVWQSFLQGEYTLCVSTDILEEYEEVLARNINQRVAQYILSALLEQANVQMVDVFFRFRLITADPDDNKFVDCAIASNARYIVTEDRHFEVLEKIDFSPSVARFFSQSPGVHDSGALLLVYFAGSMDPGGRGEPAVA